MTKIGETISAVQLGAVYQWFNCSTNLIVSGQSANSFTATVNGSYAMIITNNGCTDTSECVTITTVDIKFNEFESIIKLYPNPVNSEFVIATNQIATTESVVIQSIDARKIELPVYMINNENHFNALSLTPGIYIAELKIINRLIRLKFVKE